MSIDGKKLAATAVEQQTRLRDDAQKRLEFASAARAKADVWLADATAAYDRALSDSSADRENESLVDAAMRAAIRRDTAARDLDLVVRVHGENAATLADAEKNLAAAEAKLRLEEAYDGLLAVDGGEFQAWASADASAIVGGVTAIVGAIKSMREHINRHNDAVRKYHEAGGAPDIRPIDGSRHCGSLYYALHQNGGTLHAPNNPHALRYLCDPPSINSPFANPYETARQMVAYLLASLEQSEKNARAQLPLRGRGELLKAAEIFGSVRDRGAAARAFEEHERNSGAEREGRNITEHAARLSAASVAASRFPGWRARTESGAIVGPVETAPPIPEIDDEPDAVTVG